MAGTESIDALLSASYHAREEFARNDGRLAGTTPYVPTDWSKTPKAEMDDFYGGFIPEVNGVCERCHIVLPKSKICC